MVPFETFYVTQIQDAQPEAPVALVVRQPYQPVGNDVVFCVQLGLVPVAGLVMPNAWQANLTVANRSVTARCAISRR